MINKKLISELVQVISQVSCVLIKHEYDLFLTSKTIFLCMLNCKNSVDKAYKKQKRNISQTSQEPN